MIAMSPSDVARRATIVLTNHRGATASDDTSMQRSAEGHLTAAMTAVKDPEARIDLEWEYPSLIAGGARFTIEPADPLRLRGPRLVADLGAGFTTSILLGALDADSPFNRLDPSPAAAAARIGSILRAGAATLIRIGRGDHQHRSDHHWMRPIVDACTAIGRSVDPDSPDMIMIASRTPFSPLVITRYGDDRRGSPVPSDEWDRVVAPAYGVETVQLRYSSEIRFETLFVDAPPLDTMEVLRAMARFDATKENPWWK